MKLIETLEIADLGKVNIFLTVEEEICSVRGNVLASGNDADDKEAEDEILARLEYGDLWAWCRVIITARIEGLEELEGIDTLGCCSYVDERDFLDPVGGYYSDMKSAAIEDLKQQLKNVLGHANVLRMLEALT